MGSAISSILSIAPSVIAYTSIALVLINIHSFPFVWHFRFWWRLIPLHIDTYFRGHHAHIQKCINRSQVHGGASERAIQKRRALPDDCDFNYHLSNSCYAKNSDISRSQWTFNVLTPAMMSGAHLALGANHYTFVREIPAWSSYEMETRLLGWGDKWMYVITEFLIPPKKPSRSSKNPSRRNTRTTTEALSSPTSGTTTPAVTIPSVTVTPAEMTLPSTVNPSADADIAADPRSTSAHAQQVSQALLNKSAPASSPPSLNGVDGSATLIPSLRTMPPRSDGKVVAAYGIVEMCFKVGRVTVPPRIAFHLSGHSPSLTEQQRAINLTKDTKAAKAWLAGGWREAPDSDEIGRDILVDVMSGSTGSGSTMMDNEKDTSLESASNVATAMERAAAGLAEAALT